jgi:hypothetical protein
MTDASEVYIVNVTDVFGNEVKLTKTRWDGHITKEHPEIWGQIRKVETTIMHPNIIIEKPDRNTYIYVTDTVSRNYFNVITNSVIGMVRTVYLTSYLLEGDIIYRR